MQFHLEGFRNFWAIGLINALFLLFLSFPTDTSSFYDLSIVRLDKLLDLIITPKISTRVDRVNGKLPRILTHPIGCWVRETRSSTAKALAIYDMPGLDTVHCWSKVRSRVDWRQTNVTVRTRYVTAIKWVAWIAYGLAGKIQGQFWRKQVKNHWCILSCKPNLPHRVRIMLVSYSIHHLHLQVPPHHCRSNNPGRLLG